MYISLLFENNRNKKFKKKLTGLSTSSFDVCLLKSMTAYSTRAPNTNKIQANIQASMAVRPEKNRENIKLNI